MRDNRHIQAWAGARAFFCAQRCQFLPRLAMLDKFRYNVFEKNCVLRMKSYVSFVYYVEEAGSENIG